MERLSRGKGEREWRCAKGGASRRVGGLSPSVTYGNPITSRLLDFSFMNGADRHIIGAALEHWMIERYYFGRYFLVFVCLQKCLNFKEKINFYKLTNCIFLNYQVNTIYTLECLQSGKDVECLDASLIIF